MAKKGSRPRPATATPELGAYEAERGSGPDGVVFRGELLTDAEAVARLLGGKDIVVCGPDGWANRTRAEGLTNAAFGGSEYHNAHDTEGRWRALPHFHPSPDFEGSPHAFFERPPKKLTSKRKP